MRGTRSLIAAACAAALAVPAAAQALQAPSFSLKSKYGFEATWQLLATKGEHFNEATEANECPNAAPGPVVFRVSGAGATRSITLTDQCNPAWQPEEAKGNGWSLSVSEYKGYFVEFMPNFNTSGKRRLHYRVTWNNTTLQHGQFIVYSHHYPAHRVWEGTDAFVNYCIDKTKKLYSENLRLYCTEPAWTDTTMSIHRE